MKKLAHKLRGSITRALDAAGQTLVVDSRPQLVIADSESTANASAWQFELLAGPDLVAFEGPYVVDRSHPLTEGLSLDAIIWSAAEKNVPHGVPVITAGNRVLVADEEEASGKHRVQLAIDMQLSNLADSPEWPILIANLVVPARRHCRAPRPRIYSSASCSALPAPTTCRARRPSCCDRPMGQRHVFRSRARSAKCARPGRPVRSSHGTSNLLLPVTRSTPTNRISTNVRPDAGEAGIIPRCFRISTFVSIGCSCLLPSVAWWDICWFSRVPRRWLMTFAWPFWLILIIPIVVAFWLRPLRTRATDRAARRDARPVVVGLVRVEHRAAEPQRLRRAGRGPQSVDALGRPGAAGRSRRAAVSRDGGRGRAGGRVVRPAGCRGATAATGAGSAGLSMTWGTKPRTWPKGWSSTISLIRDSPGHPAHFRRQRDRRRRGGRRGSRGQRRHSDRLSAAQDGKRRATWRSIISTRHRRWPRPRRS